MNAERVTKIDIARQIFTEVQSEDRPRQVFLEVAQESGLSKACASTYYTMIQHEARGEDPYRYHRQAQARKAESGTTVRADARSTPAKRPAPAKRAKRASISIPEDHKWGVYEKDSGGLSASARTRSEAIELRKALDGKYTISKLDAKLH